MHAVAFSLIVWGCMFNCGAIVFLFLESRKKDLQKKTFEKNFEEIDYYLHGVRRLKIAGGSQTSHEERKGKS
jgi:hypothetical protein